MLLIKCPWCGERDMVEFTHGGDATKVYPEDPDTATAEEWHDFVTCGITRAAFMTNIGTISPAAGSG